MDEDALTKLLNGAHVSEETERDIRGVLREKQGISVTLSDMRDFLPVIQKIDKAIPTGESFDFVGGPSFGTFKQQAFRALLITLEKNKAAFEKFAFEPFSREQILSDFMTLITPEVEGTPFTGHSVSMESELYSCSEGYDSQRYELRIGPFRDYHSAWQKIEILHNFSCLDYKAPMSNLHLNWGLTQEQRKRYEDKEYKKIYDGILTKLSYLSNSVARNLFMKSHYKRDWVSVHEENFKDCSGKTDPKKKQVARLECKDFCVATDGDMEIVKFTLPTFQAALDDVQAAKRLNNDLDTIFKAARIFDSNGNYITVVPSRETQEMAAYAEILIAAGRPIGKELQADINEMNNYESDFDRLSKSCRPIVSDYLRAFVNNKEVEGLSRSPATTKALRKKYKQNVRESKHLNPHKDSPLDTWEERVSDSKSRGQVI